MWKLLVGLNIKIKQNTARKYRDCMYNTGVGETALTLLETQKQIN